MTGKEKGKDLPKDDKDEPGWRYKDGGGGPKKEKEELLFGVLPHFPPYPIQTTNQKPHDGEELASYPGVW